MYRTIRWAERVTRMEKRNVYRILVGKPEGKSPLGEPRYMWIDNIKIGVRKTRSLNRYSSLAD
jgi:hypothetical protein